jgi:hypothetical protein
MKYKERVTISDVLEAGACLDGVIQWSAAHGGAVEVLTADYPDLPYIQRAGSADGDGYGYGYGDGSG